ncbi:hypothetical protein KSP39_PZI004830 [Platanthera zijinensis]|uniref:Large ribosomal subunit protein uL11c n=1 Tax=Platanthera zijinensis TaxID=2320716 RepID=A0AAP0BZB0_9ASPA
MGFIWFPSSAAALPTTIVTVLQLLDIILDAVSVALYRLGLNPSFVPTPWENEEFLFSAGPTPSVLADAAPSHQTGKTKKVVGVIKLALDAGKATPAPPVGPALGSKGVNIMAFCKEYNAKTAEKAGYVIPVEITVYDDKSFTFVLKTPPASVLLLKAAGVEKGSKEPKSQKVGKITAEQVRAIAQEKLPDLNCVTVESAMRIIAGTAANMGIDIDPPVLESKKKQLLL